VEVAHVRNRLRNAIETARQRAQTRRQQVAEAEKSFLVFLERATPLLRQLTQSMRAEGLAFTLFTPEHALRLASDRSRIDFVELTLDTTGDQPGVAIRVSHGRGSRTVEAERLLKAGAFPHEITDEELLEATLDALTPWLER
jgi:hypothetical protein